MSTSEALFLNGKIHHAYLLIGGRDYWRVILETELKKILNIKNLKVCPDIWWQNYDSFGIKDSHALIEKEARKSFTGQGRFFILEISSITPEAQNALLKTLEEPAPDAHFFIIARSAEMFLPTLRSRTIIITQTFLPEASPRAEERNEVGSRVLAPRSLGEVGTRSNFVSAERFLKLDLPDRLDFIQKEFLKNKDIGKGEIIDFVIELEQVFRSKINIKKITKDQEIALHELEKCLRYLQNPRSSNRLILEHLALVLPIN